MTGPRRVIRGYRHEPEQALDNRNDVITRKETAGTDVIPPYYPRKPIPAGDPMSPSGTKVELSELADDVLEVIGGPSLDDILTNHLGAVLVNQDGNVLVTG